MHGVTIILHVTKEESRSLSNYAVYLFHLICETNYLSP